MPTSQQPETPGWPRTSASLAGTLIALAATADDASIIDVHLTQAARLAADTLAAVDYASITAWRGQGYTTVAASSELALAVDQAQYADRAGPCLHSLETATPVGVPDIAATMSWPGFYRSAHELGLHASLSIPLFAGSGVPIAVLNLYGRDTATMAPLIAGVRTVYTGRPPPTGNQPGMDTGAHQLLTGLAQALTVRATIQQAIGVLMARNERNAAETYRQLRLRAAETGDSLIDTATALLASAATPHSHPES
ncbi:GAF and ANTAR domain-containing protein [Actinoplanes xinjiangensis]|uniref:GAF domain-containing protein n=1 Tax=Actinoplanes xinjiangensis TaxID=512350 RepID=A0A316ED09_9ACTN|nr:GAF and ANTAR domain-containing protein [Actinoplanes xinjiangensis]PWK27509.1 GAF domain-containing protein [Actinoplanes xinjiangensis]GIF45271.1 transcriptional regulator [Actinoplanes xinjiangensis]